MVNLEVIRIFDSISPSPEDFAKKYNLRIEKYWHDWPSWRFSFKNPKQGISCLEVMLAAGVEFEVGGYWWVDDYDSGIRSTREYKSDYIKSDRITEVLEETLRIVLSWELTSLIDHAEKGLLKESWHRRSKEEFYAMNNKYPEINLNS